METLLIKVSGKKKAGMLVELLKSMDFVESVDYIGDLKQLKATFDATNDAASKTELKDMTINEINEEIKAYRLEKRAGRN